MEYVVLAVYDRAADGYGRPLFVPSVGIGLRSFQDEINRADRDNQMYQHPEDFDLYRLGTWEDSAGKFVLLQEPEQIAVGKQMVISKQ